MYLYTMLEKYSVRNIVLWHFDNIFFKLCAEPVAANNVSVLKISLLFRENDEPKYVRHAQK